MTMSVHFLCPQCAQRLGRDAGEASRPCDFCGAADEVVAPNADAVIDQCAACGHAELYFQKDFNRTTGIALVVVGSIFVPWTYGLSLLGVTILDYIAWRLVKAVTLFYESQPLHLAHPSHPPIQPLDPLF